MSALTVALAVPCAVWIPERLAMLDERRPRFAEADHYLELTDREHWSRWAIRSWKWALSTGAGWFLSLQDDVELAPHFWPSLRAILTAWPNEPIVSLAAVHSLAREVARTGRRSYRTDRVTGWGWAMRMTVLADLVGWADSGALEEFRRTMPTDGEDTFVAKFCERNGLIPRSPVPTIVDHLHVASTNDGFDNHTHRRSVVTWRGYEPADMTEPSWWQSACTDLPSDVWRRCWLCGQNPAETPAAKTGAVACRVCLATLFAATVGADKSPMGAAVAQLVGASLGLQMGPGKAGG